MRLRGAGHVAQVRQELHRNAGGETWKNKTVMGGQQRTDLRVGDGGKLAQDHVQWWSLIFTKLNLQALLPVRFWLVRQENEVLSQYKD